MNNQTQNIIPKLRFPEFKNNVDWEEKTLESVSKIIMGTSPSSSSYNSKAIGLPLIQGNADIKNRFSAPRVFTSEITKECIVDDILLGVRAPVGTVAKSLHNACIGRGISAIRSSSNNSQEYLYQWLLSYESSWSNISQGGTFDAVNSDDIKHLLLPITSPLEQQKIASCLSSLDDLITAHTQKLQALKQHKKGLMQNLFPAEGETVPKFRFKEFEDSGEWVITTIGELGKFYYGKSAPKWSLSEDAPTPCVRYGELYTKFDTVIKKTVSKTNIPKENLRFSKGGEILVPRVGELAQDFAKHCCYLPFPDIAIGEMISVFETNECAIFYTYYFRILWKEFAKVVEGQNVKNLYYVNLEPIKIAKTSIKEQQKIASCLTSLDDLITAQSQKIENLKQHKKGLMQQLFPKINS